MAKSIRRRGPGTVMKETLAAWRITPHTGCGCTEIAAEMDQVGPDIVERNLDDYTNRTYQSVKDWKATGNFIERRLPLPPIEYVKDLIVYSINVSREELAA